NKLKVFRKYLNNYLTKKFIKVSLFSVATLVIFIKKLNKKFLFFYNYLYVTTQLYFSFSSIITFHNTLFYFSKVKYFIKLDIILAFNYFYIIKENK
ncbi:hypothetical protein K469DRAFT_574056, partial [Zopfia rhizophila CBS 207.26]